MSEAFVSATTAIRVYKALIQPFSPPHRFLGAFKGDEEQARAVNILEDWGKERSLEVFSTLTMIQSAPCFLSLSLSLSFPRSLCGGGGGGDTALL